MSRVSPGVTEIVAVVCPPLAVVMPTPQVPPAPPEASTMTCVIPGGTTKVCTLPVYVKVSEPPQFRNASHVHVAPDGQPTLQSVQSPPTPQAPSAVPGVHVPPPPADTEQQPPLQGCVYEHAVVQVAVAVSHASSTGQSVVVVHPHLPLGRQTEPGELPAHETHAAPVEPHRFFAVPGAHVPVLELQQPPLQG